MHIVPLFLWVYLDSAERPLLILNYPPLYTNHHFQLPLVNSIGIAYLRYEFNRVHYA